MSRGRYKTAGPIIDTFFSQNKIPTVASLTPAQLNELYDALAASDANAWPCGEDESRIKTNLISWVRKNKPKLESIAARGTWSVLLDDSMKLREEEGGSNGGGKEKMKQSTPVISSQPALGTRSQQKSVAADVVKKPLKSHDGKKVKGTTREPCSVADKDSGGSGCEDDRDADQDVRMKDRRISEPSSANILTSFAAMTFTQPDSNVHGFFGKHSVASGGKAGVAPQAFPDSMHFTPVSNSGFGSANPGVFFPAATLCQPWDCKPSGTEVRRLEILLFAATQAFAAGKADIAAMELAKAGAVIAPFLPSFTGGDAGQPVVKSEVDEEL